ncbi:uncharacterized protein A4U43_C08F29340 [Asparagus officinalis]|uniref:disease resistance protein RFL1-like n=1 Tax=Asparagus officinalis TaxID=4686 RepID=UPI00098E2277|nr:disease resistance protein RFL1-like [Asparagus officinalis]ONK61383.1 uncharacterized protein A4U43_C08F29340 [Asparagus officinalis]
MAGKSRPELWGKALNDLRASKMISGRKDDPLSLLKVSYDYLQNPAWQECLLLCALWPEDFEIPEDVIIECWMGHGLLGDFNNMEEAYANGYEIVDGLHKASLLEYSEDEYLRGVVRLHDLIRDMALWVASGGKGKKWVVLSGVDGASDEALRDKMLWREAHKISLMYNLWLQRLPPDISAPNLVTLVIDYCGIGLLSYGLGSIQNFRNLTFLDLSSNVLGGIPVEICRLSKLEYLNLSANLSISSLPRELEDLKRLKYLLLSNTAISEAPRELFSSMDSLEVLDLSSSLKKISQGSIINNNLDGLKGRLKGLGINACSRRDIDKLGELSVPITRLVRWITEYETGPSLDLLPRRKHPRDPTWSNMIHLGVVGRVGLSGPETAGPSIGR